MQNLGVYKLMPQTIKKTERKLQNFALCIKREQQQQQWQQRRVNGKSILSNEFG